jgi:hypothetical protein
MAQVTIEQRPLYNFLPIGQQIIFAVADNTTVAEKFRVKFVAEVHVSNKAINPSSTDDLIGYFKTTPNNAGVGIFDLRPILETFVKADNEASIGDTSYKLNKDIDLPLHLVDRFSLSDNSIRNFQIQFSVEYSETADGALVNGGNENSDSYMFFNGVLQYDDALDLRSGNYGYDLSLFQYGPGTQPHFLSFNRDWANAPITQYARLTDYGTLSFFNWRFIYMYAVVYEFYEADGSLIGSQSVANVTTTGGSSSKPSDETRVYLEYVAMGPANLRQWNPAMEAWFAAGSVDYYTIKLINESGTTISQTNKVKIICPNERGYEGIRLAWLNGWGTWDYYTFTMKSTRTTSAKRIPYTQQSGTWNESTFKIKGWKGGKKNFRVNSTEKIKINTDFVTEEEGVWFEELINSQDVYIVNEYSAGDDSELMTNKYVEPVTLTTSNYVKKTIANDKLMQYTFEIEKSKMKRTQAV